VTGGGDEIVTPRPDRSVFAELEVDVIHAVTPSTLADELTFRLVVLDGDLGNTFIDFSKDELAGAGLVASLPSGTWSPEASRA
jgi:hypothetical protein